MFAVYVVVSHDGAGPRRIYSSAGAGVGPNNVDSAPPSHSKHRGKPARASASNQDWSQKHRHNASEDVTTTESGPAAGRLESGASGQKRNQGRIKTSKDKASTYLQHRQSYGSPATPSSQSPAVPQSALHNQQLPRSMSLLVDLFLCMIDL